MAADGGVYVVHLRSEVPIPLVLPGILGRLWRRLSTPASLSELVSEPLIELQDLPTSDALHILQESLARLSDAGLVVTSAPEPEAKRE